LPGFCPVRVQVSSPEKRSVARWKFLQSVAATFSFGFSLSPARDAAGIRLHHRRQDGDRGVPRRLLEQHVAQLEPHGSQRRRDEELPLPAGAMSRQPGKSHDRRAER
jgi:hypothetical protein